MKIVILYLNIKGLGPQLINSCFEKQKLILGMTEIIDTTVEGVTYVGQCAENIKYAIEKIINSLSLKKKR